MITEHSALFTATSRLAKVIRDFAIRNAQLGYGWDYLARGFRTGFEIKVSVAGDDGEGLVRIFVVWGRK